MENNKKNYSLDGKVCVITGGLGLLGREFSKQCAQNGAEVLILDINGKNNGKTINEIKESSNNKGNVYFYDCNITDTEQIQSVLGQILKKHKKIDCLVNSAYPKNKNYGRKFEDVTYDDFCENVNLHLGGYFLITKEISKIMKKQKSGSIVNLASIYGFHAPRFDIYENTEMTVPVEYAAIKGGLINLTKYLASYLGPYNIRVNAISPGGIFDNQDSKFVDKYVQYVKCEKRMANPNDLQGILLFLLSDDSSYLTGQNIVVDGGWTL